VTGATAFLVVVGLVAWSAGGPASAAGHGCDLVQGAPADASIGFVDQAISDDGTRLAYATTDGAWVLDADDGQARRVWPQRARVTLSGDGEVAVVRHDDGDHRTRLTRVVVATGEAEQISPDQHTISFADFPVLSADGSRIAFLTFTLTSSSADLFDRQAWVWSPEGVSELPTPAGMPLFTPALAGDGTRAALVVDADELNDTRGDRTLHVFEPEGDGWVDQGSPLAGAVGGVVLDADGDRVLYDHGGVGAVLRQVGGATVRTAGEASWSSDLSADGSTFLWEDGDSRFRRTRLVDGTWRTVLLRGPSGQVLLAPSTSADGRRVAAFDWYGGLGIYECGDFGDVAPSHPFVEDIAWMDEQGISTGYADGDFQPEAAVSRQAMAAFLHRLAGAPATTPPAEPTFTDVGAGHPFRDEVEWMAGEQIAAGFEDGTFRPLVGVTRQAMAAFLFRVADEPSTTPPAEATFSDVGPDHPFSTEVEWMAATEISTGYEDGTYRPALPVSRMAMSAFLHRLSEVLAP
jgi:hypothetical protein